MQPIYMAYRHIPPPRRSVPPLLIYRHPRCPYVQPRNVSQLIPADLFLLSILLRKLRTRGRAPMLRT
jgi:hypothetical protein